MDAIHLNDSDYDKDIMEMPEWMLRDMGLDCPINNEGGLNPAAFLLKLFDGGAYIEHSVGNKNVALGFIDSVPARCEYEPGLNSVWIIAILPKKVCDYKSWRTTLPGRTADKKVFPKVTYWSSGWWNVGFYYRPGYARHDNKYKYHYDRN